MAVNTKRVLIVYYSFSGQTQLLIQKLVNGLEEEGVEVVLERLEPVVHITFPFLTWKKMADVMISSFFRRHVQIFPVDHLVDRKWDSVILAGPTWSYNPSGPMLDFLDRYGSKLLAGTTVIPFISCRSYWRVHYWGLKAILKNFGARVKSPIVYLHSSSEPWRTIGLFLQLVGRLPRLESSWFRKRYPRYGHSKEQYEDAIERGRELAIELAERSE